ncbi:hypothetical protein [Vibrio phage VP41s3]|nr:hypothetical protein [Vibrio phage VP41s3]
MDNRNEFTCENCGASYTSIEVLGNHHNFELGDDYFLQIKRCQECGGKSEVKEINMEHYFYETEESDCAGGACKI